MKSVGYDGARPLFSDAIDIAIQLPPAPPSISFLSHLQTPTGTDAAAVAPGVPAGVEVPPPSYTGSLTLNANSTLLIRRNYNNADIFSVLGGGPITMHAGTTINTATPAIAIVMAFR